MDEADQAFALLLESLSTPENSVRARAEQEYEALKEREDGFLPFSLLTTIVATEVPSHIRKLSAVLLRRILLQDENSAYSQLSEERQLEFRSQLLQALDNETDAYLKARICDIVGELANFVIDEWPEILPYAHHCLQSVDCLQKETGLALLNLLAEQVASLLCNGDTIETMIPIFEHSLVDNSNDGRIMLSALRALASILSCVAQPSDVEKFEVLLAPLLNGLQMLLQWEGGEAAALNYVESMIEISEECVAFYENQLDDLFANIVTYIAVEGNVSTALRHMFMELLVTLCGETTKKIRKMKGPDGQKGFFIQTLTPICVEMMISIPEDPNWSQSDTAEENDAEDVLDCDVGETSLDRMCKDLGLTATWATVSSQFTTLLESEDVWQHCHAGLRCLGNYMEVSKNITNKKQLRQHVMDMALLILPFMKHGHDRVRAAAYYAFGQFITMHGRGQGLDSSQVDQTVPLLLEGLPSSVNMSPRVRRNALIALSNTVDICPSNIIQKHAGDILEAVAYSLAEGPVIVQEMCVAVIIGLAETSEGSVLCEYYDSIIPVLKQLLTYSMSNGLESLWGQGMECCAMVGEASGKEKFYPDALEMMNSLVAMGSELEEGSEARTYLMKAWVRIARCLGSDFLPFLQLVMAQLMTAIQQDVIADSEDPEELETRSDIHMVEMESGWVAVRTAAVEEQSSACQLIMLMVEKLQEHFYPYVETTVNAIAPLFESPHEDVRSFCMVAIPELVRSTAKATSPDRTALINLTEYFVGLLVKSIESESSLELIMTGLQALRASFSYACTDWTTHTKGMGEPTKITPATSIRFLNISQMEAITQCATLVLRDSLQRRAMLRAEAQVSGGGVVDEDDMGDEELFQQNCMELHFNLAELIGTVFKTHGSDFMDVYKEVWHETVVEMVHVNCLKEDRQFGYFIISDVIEFGLTNDTAGEYFEAVMGNVLEGCGAEEAGIRQTSVYCVGIAAELYPSIFAPFAASSLSALSGAIAIGDGEESRGMSTDNAVSSVGILLENMEIVFGDSDESLTSSFPYVWGEWLAYLPLRDDVEEGARVLRQLTKLLRNKHPTLFSSLERVQQAVIVLIEVLGTELVGTEITREIVHTLQLMRVGESLLGKGGLDELCTNLEPEAGEKLKQYLSMDFSSPLESSSPQAPAPIHDVLMRF